MANFSMNNNELIVTPNPGLGTWLKESEEAKCPVTEGYHVCSRCDGCMYRAKQMYKNRKGQRTIFCIEAPSQVMIVDDRKEK